jgi:hypothetical protein
MIPIPACPGGVARATIVSSFVWFPGVTIRVFRFQEEKKDGI